MTIVLYTLGFVSLLCAIVVLLLSLVAKGVPHPEPELLVVDAPLPGEADLVEESSMQEARA